MSSSGKHEVAGEMAIEITRDLAEPLRGLRDRLGLVVDQLERHVATSTGPTPYSWRSLQTLRQDLAAAYLEVTTLARRLDELDRALDDDPPGWFDLATAVDLGLRIANHHLGPDIELHIDLSSVPAVRGTPGMLSLLVAQLVAACARSARELPGSALSVRVINDGPWAAVLIGDNGAGTERALALGELARDVLVAWGATIEATSEPGQGCAFELRLMTAS